MSELHPFLFLFLVLVATLALHLVGLSWPTVICHPLLSLQSVAEMLPHNFQSLKHRIAQRVEPGTWDRFGASVRGDEPDHDDDDQDDERAAPNVFRSYRELGVNAEAGGSTGQYYPGLLNAAGNLCFLNATLQSMASTPSLLLYLHRTTTLGLSFSPTLPTPVAISLLSTLRQLNTPTTSPSAPLRPIALLQSLAASSSERRRLLASGDQQDAHELWGMIREAVDDELVRLEAERNKRSDGGLADLLGGRPRRRRAAVKDPFLHLVSQKIRCVACGYTRDVRHTGEVQVPLVVPPVASCSIYDLLAEYTKQDLLSDYACRKCALLATRDKLVSQRDRLSAPPAPSTTNPFEHPPPPTMTQSRKDRRKKVQKLVDKVEAALAASDFERELGSEVRIERVEGPAGKLIRFARTPDILTIHINRSSHFGRTGGAVKNPCQVAFPELLEFGPYCDHGESETYRLASLVVHYGSHSFGHYVAFRRRPSDPHAPPPPPPTPQDSEALEGEAIPEWYRISDETVQPARLDDALRSNPFLMFYERVRKRAEGRVEGVVPRVVESWGLGRGTPKEG